jgi:hypothetical protein
VVREAHPRRKKVDHHELGTPGFKDEYWDEE